MPTLHIVSTPIGNLQDISLRALHHLRTAALLAAEDTRVARRLLAGVGVPPPPSSRLISLRAQNEQQAAQKVIAALRAGGDVVYISDAGTPGLSDPGSKLVRAVRDAGFAASPVPGASALTALCAVAALDEGAVHFHGFPPAAAAARRKFFAALRQTTGTCIFYEAPHRIAATLADLSASWGGAQRVVIGRELTKKHEQIADTTLAQAAAAVASGGIPARGEFCLAATPPPHRAAAEEGWRVFNILLNTLPPRQAAAAAAKISGEKASALYQRHIRGGVV